jgi:Holliday junction resolvasome RuvABC endonuclease subunit
MPVRKTRRSGRRTTKQQQLAKRSKRRQKAAGRTPWTTTGDASRLLAFDVSSVCVGWTLFVNGKLAQSGKYLQRGEGHGERLITYAAWLRRLFDDLAPSAVAVEAPYQGRNPVSFAVLTLYRAALLMVHFNYFHRELPDNGQVPAYMVKRVLGVERAKSTNREKRHEENKRIVVDEINRLYDTNFRFVAEDKKKTKTEDDIADAVAVAHVWLALHESVKRPSE